MEVPNKFMMSYYHYYGTAYYNDYAWMRDNGWGLNIGANHEAFTSASSASNYYHLALSTLSDEQIPVLIQLNTALGDYGNTPWAVETTTGDEYEALYGDAVRYFDSHWGSNGSEGDCVVGYWYESAHDTAAEWLRDATDLLIRYGTGEALWYLVDHPESQYQRITDMDLRVSKVDGIDIEIWQLCDLGPEPYGWDNIGCAQWIQENYPDLSLGIDSMPFVPPAYNEILLHYWTYYGKWYGAYNIWPGDSPPGTFTLLPDRVPSIEESKHRYLYYLNYFKEQLDRPFDVLVAEVTGADDTHTYTATSSNPSWWDWIKSQLEYQDNANLTGSGTKPLTEMSQTGVVIPYLYVSQCVHNFPDHVLSVAPLDSFANTGNELILLKDYSTASTHDITVTSTDTLTHKDYTLTCLPDRGTIIGPYPLNDYGALPTIEYDNTNLYVSILQDEPYEWK